MKKIMLITVVLGLSIFASAQHMETTLKIVGGKARIVVKAVGGDIVGSPSGTTFCIRIPAANAAATITSPSSPVAGPVSAAGPGILNAARLPTTIQTGTFTDANFKYFIFLLVNGNASLTFVNNTEYEVMELVWGGPSQQNCPVSLFSYPNGVIGNGNTVLEGQWINYLEVGGAQYSFGDQLFYQSVDTGTPTQQAADYSSGTALVSSTPFNLILPVNLLNFSGYKNGTKNKLLWTTASEANNLGFEVQRSTDGVTYSAIGFVNSQVTGGNSSTSLSYTFDDNNPASVKKQYYRLRQVDFDGRSKQSNVVLIKSDKPDVLGIGGLFPNPASTVVNVLIDAPGRDNVTLVITDMSGKTVKQQSAGVETGSNTVPMDIAKLAAGSYLVKVLCKSSDCETAVAKFNKQ